MIGAMGQPMKKAAKLARAAHLRYFTEDILGVPCYAWQHRVMEDLDRTGARVALRAANGSGKTSHIAAPAALWHAAVFPGSVTITTSGVYRQVKEQLWPTIRRLSRVLPGFTINATDLTTGDGSRIIGFSTDDPGRFEGFHSENLFIIVDEAKSVREELFEAIERCQPNRLLVMSSPGSSKGFFYDVFHKHRELFQLHSVTAFDCKHIMERREELVDRVIKQWGDDHPLVRSMIYGEFMMGDDENLVVDFNRLEECIANPPAWDKDDVPVAGVDVAAGGDENVVVIRRGNRIEKPICWRDKDTMRMVGRLISILKEHKVPADNVFMDAGGLGIPVADRLAEVGWPVHRINFGSRARDDRYVSRVAEMWFETARMIHGREIILPQDDALISQLSQRRTSANSRGLLALETKGEMKSRGLSSPDRADAMVLAATNSPWEVETEWVRPTLSERFGDSLDLEDEGADLAEAFDDATIAY